MMKQLNMVYQFCLENFVPTLRTANASQWLHGTLSRSEAIRILQMFITANLEHQVLIELN